VLLTQCYLLSVTYSVLLTQCYLLSVTYWVYMLLTWSSLLNYWWDLFWLWSVTLSRKSISSRTVVYTGCVMQSMFPCLCFWCCNPVGLGVRSCLFLRNPYAENFVENEKTEKPMWTLQCDSKTKGKEFMVTCDYLVIATGHHAKPKLPSFPGQDTFEGRLYLYNLWPSGCSCCSWCCPFSILFVEIW